MWYLLVPRVCAGAGGPHIHPKLRPVLDLLLAARPGARDYVAMRAFVRAPARGRVG